MHLLHVRRWRFGVGTSAAVVTTSVDIDSNSAETSRLNSPPLSATSLCGGPAHVIQCLSTATHTTEGCFECTWGHKLESRSKVQHVQKLLVLTVAVGKREEIYGNHLAKVSCKPQRAGNVSRVVWRMQSGAHGAVV